MKLYEYQAKRLFSESGIIVPRGEVVTSPEEAAAALDSLPFSRYVLKAQTHTGGRGKAGLVRAADGREAAFSEAEVLLRSAGRVLVEERLEIAEELYAGFTLDRSRACYALIFSRSGGVDIEELSREHPEKILTREIDILTGLLPHQVRELVTELPFEDTVKNGISRAVTALYAFFYRTEATLCEINPLAVTGGGEVVAADAKIIFDDDAFFRHPELQSLRIPEDEEPAERDAKEKKLSYVKLDGSIGCMVNGAGLAMATMDVLTHFGGSPANFLDIGGGAKSNRVKDALFIINRDRRVKAIFINIFGGIVRCDEVARGIVEAKSDFSIEKPIIIRLVGTNDEAAYALLKREGLSCHRNMSEAAKAAIMNSRLNGANL